MAACLTGVGVVVGEQCPSFFLLHGHVMFASNRAHSKSPAIMKSKLCCPSSIQAQVVQVAQRANLGAVLQHRLLQTLQLGCQLVMTPILPCKILNAARAGRQAHLSIHKHVPDLHQHWQEQGH